MVRPIGKPVEQPKPQVGGSSPPGRILVAELEGARSALRSFRGTAAAGSCATDAAHENERMLVVERERRGSVSFMAHAVAMLCVATGVVGCGSGATPAQSAAPVHAPVMRGATSARVFESPYVQAWHAGFGAGSLETRPEYDRRAGALSQRSYWPVLGTRQWPEPARPAEDRIPTIYSRWGRSF